MCFLTLSQDVSVTLQKPNKGMYNFFELSGHNLESFQA
jgi:hypothetical protein